MDRQKRGVLLRTKISLNFLIMSALILFVGVGYYFSSVYLKREFRNMERMTFASISALTDSREMVWSLWRYREQDEELEENFRRLESLLIRYGRVSEQDIAPRLSGEMRRKVLDLQESFSGMELAEFTRVAESLSLMLGEAMTLETQALSERSGSAMRMLTLVSRVSLALTSFAVLLCLIPGWWLANHISCSLRKTQLAAEEVARGHLDQRLPEKHNDELSRMAHAFNRMVDTIRQADEEITREVEERIEAEQRAQVAAKAKSDFLAQMSHEFRTPLNGILGYAQLLSLDSGMSETNKGVVKRLSQSGENLLELVNDVLDLSKIEAKEMSLKKSRFYLEDFLKSLQQSVQGRIEEKGLLFKFEIDDQLPEDVLADPIRLRQILVNLLGNATKFTTEGWVGLRVCPGENGIRFEVFDTGVGIPESEIENVLQPFRQVQQDGVTNQGTGLGLPISNRLLQAMGATLAIKSKVGKGSTFWFELPQPDLKSRKLVQAPSRISGFEGPPRKVLIGESGREVTGVLIPLLREVGFEVLVVPEPKDFVQKTLLFEPDAVLIDLYFAGGDGLKTVRALEQTFLEQKTTAPVMILFSDHRHPEDRERSLKAGVTAFLGAPIRFQDLLEVLQDSLKLVWTEKATAGAAVDNTPVLREKLPSQRAILELLELVKTGNTKEVRSKLEEVKASEPEAELFLNRMLSFAERYRMNDIQRSLEEKFTAAGLEKK